MKATLFIVGVASIALLVAVFAVVSAQNRERRIAQSDQERLHAELGAAIRHISALEAKTVELSALAQSQQELLGKLAADLAEAREKVDAADTPAPISPRAFRVPVYIGTDYLGAAWMLPRNAGINPESGRIIFQPVLQLDSALRGKFTVTNTAIVEREIVRNDTVNNVYYPRPVVLVHKPHHGNPSVPAIPPTGPPHQMPQANQTQRRIPVEELFPNLPYNRDSSLILRTPTETGAGGGIRPQKLGIPASDLPLR